MDFINEIALAVALAEFVLRIDQNQSLPGRDLLPPCEEPACPALDDGIIFGRHDTLPDDFFLGDVQVVPLVRLGRRGDYRFRETLVLTHSVGKSHTAELAAAFLVSAPCRTREDGTDDHFHTKAFTLQTDRHHGIRRSQLPVGTDVGRLVEELGCNLIQHLTLERYALRQYHIECRDPVGSYHDDEVVVDVVHITYFAVIHTLLSIKMEISLCQCFHFLLCL